MTKSTTTNTAPAKPTRTSRPARKATMKKKSNGSEGGRPTKYKPEYVAIARQMCRLGATDADLAKAFDVTTVTIWNWQAKHEEFFNALKVGKGQPDDRVERSLSHQFRREALRRWPQDREQLQRKSGHETTWGPSLLGHEKKSSQDEIAEFNTAV